MAERDRQTGEKLMFAYKLAKRRRLIRLGKEVELFFGGISEVLMFDVWIYNPQIRILLWNLRMGRSESSLCFIFF